MKTIIIFSILLISFAARADYLPWSELQNRFSKLSKHPKALSHVKCFFKNHINDKFQLKRPQDENFYNRCFAEPIIGLDSARVFAIIDYTVNSPREEKWDESSCPGNFNILLNR